MPVRISGGCQCAILSDDPPAAALLLLLPPPPAAAPLRSLDRAVAAASAESLSQDAVAKAVGGEESADEGPLALPKGTVCIQWNPFR